VGMCGDKDAREFLRPLAKLAKRLWVVPVQNERNMPPDRLRAAAAGLGWTVTESSLAVALDEATRWASAEHGAVCIAGSLYLVGEVLAQGAKVDPN